MTAEEGDGPEATRRYVIDALGGQGDGIAHDGARAVFIPFALPGETVDWNGAAPHVIGAPSTDRATPACPHFGTCGGCLAQHMSDDLYARWKSQIVADAFMQRGLAEVSLQPLIRCAPGSRRRAVLSARREGKRVQLGYHGRRSHDLIDIEACPVLAPAITAALPTLRDMVATLDVAEVRLTVLATDAGLDVLLAAETKRLSAQVASAIGRIAVNGRCARVSLNGEPIVSRAAPALDMGGVAVTPPPGGFVQAVDSAEEAMRRVVVSALPKAKRVADLFCGLGAFSFALAARARVLAADSDKEALAALGAALRHTQGLKPVEVLTRDLYREPLSPLELKEIDAVVLDPPRAGAQAQAEALSKSVVPLVCYVSCNPTTLARDARLLVDGGYTLEAVTPIDQFLYSAHVEAVAILRRSGKKARK